MQLYLSKLTNKFQVIVPKVVRKKLNLKAGDAIQFYIENESVLLRKARTDDIDLSSALVPTLSEWESTHDEEAYKELQSI